MNPEKKEIAKKKETPSFLTQGLNLLREAQSENFSSGPKVQDIYRLLKQAISQTPALAEPYLAMAYLLLLAGDRNSAKLILKEALLHSPENPDALKMLDLIAKTHRSQTKSNPQLDWDAFRDQVETMIVKHFHHYSKYPTDSDQGNVSPATFERFSSLLNTINTYIQTLEQEFDVMDLRGKLHPLQVLWKRQKQKCDLDQLYIALIQNIEEAHHQVDHIIQESKTSKALAKFENEIEAILDQCDLIADKLDDLNQQGHDIQNLEITYNQWIEKVAVLQALLDESNP